MLLMNAMSVPSGDQVGCAAFDAGSGAPVFLPVVALVPPSLRIENGPGGAPLIPSGKRGF